MGFMKNADLFASGGKKNSVEETERNDAATIYLPALCFLLDLESGFLTSSLIMISLDPLPGVPSPCSSLPLCDACLVRFLLEEGESLGDPPPSSMDSFLSISSSAPPSTEEIADFSGEAPDFVLFSSPSCGAACAAACAAGGTTSPTAEDS
jgi:hypothetical protein